MNKDRRARLRAVRNKLNDAREEVVAIRDEEDETRDNMPENLAYSERYERSEECSGAMDAAIDSIDEAIGSIEEAI